MGSWPTTLTRLGNAWCKVINKYTLDRILSPFRSRLQDRLRRERTHIDADMFVRELDDGGSHPEIARALWALLRERAFVEDFRPAPGDELYKVFAMDPEIVRDELIDVLLTKLELNVNEIDFAGFDFGSIATPRDVSKVLVKIAGAQGGKGKQQMSDIASHSTEDS